MLGEEGKRTMTGSLSQPQYRVIVGAFIGATMSLVSTTTAAKGQVVATVQNIQPAPLTITKPYTTFTSELSAIVTLQINEPATLTVSPPALVDLEDPPGTQQTSSLSYNNNTVTNNTPLNINTPGPADVAIDMEVIRAQPYPVNDYTYSI